jgi:ribose transport system substrate-binding protein
MAAKKLRVLLSLITRDNDYQQEQATAAKAAAGRLGVDLQVLFADNDAIRQSSQILDVVQSTVEKADAIMVEPASQTGFPKVASAAIAAGTAWVVLNSEADYLKTMRSATGVPAFAVSADNYQVGRIQGLQLAGILPSGGNVLYLQGPSTSSVVAQRTKGLLETKPERITLKTLRSVDWTEDGGCHAVSSWLRLSTARTEKIDVIQAQNDFLALGARRAIEQENCVERGNRSRTPFLGVDGLERTGQAWVRQGLLMATVVVPPVAGQALEALMSALRTGTQPPERTMVAPRPFPEATVSRAWKATL